MLAVMEKEQLLSGFSGNLDQYKYLANLSEDVIYQIYEPIITKDHTKPFTEFTQDHRDAYLRLKLRSVKCKGEHQINEEQKDAFDP